MMMLCFSMLCNDDKSHQWPDGATMAQYDVILLNNNNKLTI